MIETGSYGIIVAAVKIVASRSDSKHEPGCCSRKGIMTVKSPKAELGTTITSYRVRARLLTPMLGTAPQDASLYTTYLIEKALKTEYQAAKGKEDVERIDKVKAAMIAQELTTLPGQKGANLITNSPDEVKEVLTSTLGEEESENVVKGKTVYRRTQNGTGGPMLVGYMLRGFIKEGLETHTDIPQPASKVDKFLWIGEFEIPIIRDGSPLTDVDGEWSRPLRTKDQRTGVSRTCIATSEFVNPIGDTEIEFTIFIMPKGFSTAYTGGKMSKDDIERTIALGLAFGGVGQYRNGGHGCFEVVSFTEEEVDWKTALAARVQMLKQGQQLYGSVPEEAAEAAAAD